MFDDQVEKMHILMLSVFDLISTTLRSSLVCCNCNDGHMWDLSDLWLLCALDFIFTCSKNLWDGTGSTISKVGISWMLSLAAWPVSHEYIWKHYQTSFLIAGFWRMLDSNFPSIPSGDLPSLTEVDKLAKLLEVSLHQTAKGKTVLSITMQSLGSTPLLPLISMALRWKIHQAGFTVCFRKQAMPCFVHTVMHFSCFHTFCLFFIQCSVYY